VRSVSEPRSPGVDIALFVLSLFLALVIQTVATRWDVGASIFINLPLIVLFIWAARRPYWVSPPVLLLVGFLQDLFAGTPLGLWGIAYLAAFTLARDREADGSGADLGPYSARFVVLGGLAYLFAWCAGSVAIGAPASYQTLIGEAILTILLFPLFAWAFARRKERGTYF
jgi:rod shape-determining protein MreD